MLLINEGFVLDEAGNLITTSFVELRPPESRTAVRTLVKGCRRKHALERTQRGSSSRRFHDSDTKVGA